MDRRFPPREDVVIPDILERFAAETPDKIFAVFPTEEWTYQQTADEVWACATGLQNLGVRYGDTVCAWLPNGTHCLRTWFGSNALGAAFAPLNPAYRGSILEHAINYSHAETMVAPAAFVERLCGLRLDRLRTVVVVGGDPVDVPQAPPGVSLVPWRDVRHIGSPRPDPGTPIEPWDITTVIYTSGTTGPSKAVLCSYLHHKTYCTELHPGASADDRFFCCLPMFHTGGSTAIYSMLLRGASVAITDGFRTETFLAEANRFQTSLGVILGSMAMFLLKREPGPEDRDHSIRQAIVTPMVPDVDAFRQRFGIDIYTAYGLTEGTCPLRTELNPVNPLSCGRPVNSDYELRLVDDHDREVDTGEVGELIMRHTRPWSLNSGYRGMPEQTAEAWRNGWFHTGDLLSRDAEENYYFVDRKKDALRRRGENISSMEVEKEILAHPDIVDVAVVGVPSADLEDEIKAVISVRPDATIGPGELAQWLVPRMPYFMVPRYFELRETLPKTESQKTRKHLLREEGITASTWDRELAGMQLKREHVTLDSD